MNEKIEPVRKSVIVGCSVAEAFRLFTDEMESWWPLATHSIGQEDAKGCYFEGHAGGRIYETDADGAINLWGMVTVWEPPARVVFSWHPGRDAVTAQEVELRFGESDEGTLVELEHRDWEVLGDKASETRAGYDQGWLLVLEGFVARCS